MNYWLIAIVTFLIGLISCFGLLKLFPKIGLMDRPHRYGLKRDPIPYYGGLAIIVTFYISALLFLQFDLKLIVVLLGGVLIGIMSFIDDFRGLSPKLRLLIQLLIAIGVFSFGVQLDVKSLPFGESIENFVMLFAHGEMVFWLMILISFFATLAWFILIINSINWIDGLDGLSSGVSSIAFFVLFLLSIKPDFHTLDQTSIAVLALILAVASFVFWMFHFSPAKIMMGDTGSMFMGYFIAILAIFSGMKLATVLLVLGFPILDAIWTVLRRILSGVSPLKGDTKHFHHRLLNAGLSVRQSLFVIYSMCAFFGLLAIFLDSEQKLWAMLILLFVMSLLVFWSVVESEQKMLNK